MENKGCSICGSTEIHACPGFVQVAWTKEKIEELAKILAEYEVEENNAK